MSKCGSIMSHHPVRSDYPPVKGDAHDDFIKVWASNVRYRLVLQKIAEGTLTRLEIMDAVKEALNEGDNAKP